MAPRTKKQYEQIREEKRELIMNTALRLFSSKGYVATSINEIAKESRISKGLMYNYFKSKEDLLMSLIGEYMNLMSSILDSGNNDEVSDKDFERFIDRMTESFVQNRELWKLYIKISLQAEVANVIVSQVESGEAMLRHKVLIMKYFKDRFENPEEEALLFNSIIKGLSIQLVYAPEWYSKELVDSLVNKIKSMFIKEIK